MPGEEGGITVEDNDAFQNHLRFLETTGVSDINTAFRLLREAFLTQPESTAKWNETAEMMHGIEPQNPLEGLLVTQMIGAHNMSMEFARRAMIQDQYFDARNKYASMANKMMKTFAMQAEALHKLRNGGKQTVIVKHQQVNVNDQAQAIVGNVQQEGEGGNKKNGG